MKDIQQTINTIVEKYDSKEFMYIEYPHKSFWSEEFGERDLKKALHQLFESQSL